MSFFWVRQPSLFVTLLSFVFFQETVGLSGVSVSVFPDHPVRTLHSKIGIYVVPLPRSRYTASSCGGTREDLFFGALRSPTYA